MSTGAGAAGAASAASLSGPLPDVAQQGTLVWDVERLGYAAEEYLLCGRANTYAPVAMADAANMLTRDTPHDMARRETYVRPIVNADEPYCTRVLLYGPKDSKRFSGRVVIETAHPLDGGRAIVWSQLSGYFAQRGDIYLGIAPPVTFESLRASNPTRYAKLGATDPTQLWGMIAQLGALVRGGQFHGIPRARLHTILLTGYSWTGVAVTTFANFHHEDARLADRKPVFDGYVSIANSMYARPIDVPVIRVMTQSDFNSFDGLNNRRDDSDDADSRFRLWEVTGASHLNASPVIQPGASPWVAKAPVTEPRNLPRFSASECQRDFPAGWGPNTLPLNYIMISAFEHIDRWIHGGPPPPRAARIETAADGSAKTDSDGNALGGLRLPQIEVPAARYGTATGACFLYGYRLPFDPVRLRELYGTQDRYRAQLDAAARAQVEHGWLRFEEANLIENAARQLPAF
jgi:Alpha/beta hydrolase domain